MSTHNSPSFRRAVVATALLLLLACEHDHPLTPVATRPVDNRLLAQWVSLTPQREWMNIARLDEHHYVVCRNGDLYRVHHSEVAGLPLVSVENLGQQDARWVYVEWKLDDSNGILTLKTVSGDVVPKDASPEAAVALITANRESPKLLVNEIAFKRN